MEYIKIYLKSGNIIELECEDWEFKVDNETGEFTGYTLKRMKGFDVISIVPSQIEAYVVKSENTKGKDE